MIIQKELLFSKNCWIIANLKEKIYLVSDSYSYVAGGQYTVIDAECNNSMIFDSLERAINKLIYIKTAEKKHCFRRYNGSSYCGKPIPHNEKCNICEDIMEGMEIISLQTKQTYQVVNQSEINNLILAQKRQELLNSKAEIMLQLEIINRKLEKIK